jgi:hypothetical protein
LLLVVLRTFVIEALIIDVVIVIVVRIHIVLVVVGILHFSFQVLIKELVLLLSILPGSGRIKN